MLYILIFLKLLILINTSHGFLNDTDRKLLKLIEGSMNTSVDPCHNFYQYACGNWDNVHTDISKYTDFYDMTDYKTNQEMINLLAAEEKPKQPKFVTTVRAYYKSCVAVKQVRPIEYFKWLEATEGINMILTDSNSTITSIDLQWIKYLAIMNKYGLRGIFLEETYYISLEGIKLTKPLRKNGFKRVSHHEFDYLTKNTLSFDKIFNIKWRKFQKFENDLMQIHTSANGTNDKYYTMETLSEIPWLYRYVKLLLQNTRFPEIDLTVLVMDIDYVSQLYELLQQYSDKFLCEYLKIRFLWHLHDASYPPNTTPETCASKARKYLYLATDYLFEQHHVDLMQSIPKIHTMFSNIKHHYAKVLSTNPNRFNSTVLQFLLDKLNKTQLMVGLLPRTNTVVRLEELYSGLNLNESGGESYYANQMKVFQFKANASHIMRVQVQEDPSKYLEHDKSISPFYIQSWNIVVLPITTLQMPIYDRNLADFFTYSSLGYIIGHELSHALDTTGLKYDANGRWTDIHHKLINANEKYQRKLRCLRRLPSGDVDEKSSDVAGFRVAFQTYFGKNRKIRDKPININGMKMSMGKLFFLNYAHFRCSSSHQTTFNDIEHGTDEDRIIDALSHFPEFAQTFKCPMNANMHVKDTCQLWRK